MAKKTDLDDIDFDSIDDFDFNMDLTNPKDDRKPVKKIAAGFMEGLKSTLTDKQFIKKTVLKTLPPGYSRGADLVSEVTENLSDLYNTAAKELEPAGKMAAKATKASLPKLKGKLPKKVYDKLEATLERLDSGTSNRLGINQDEANTALELGEIFKSSMEQQQSLAEKAELSNKLTTVMNFKQNKESLNELSIMRQGMDRLVGYQDSINFKYQKKSLELQYKQFFVQRDMLELTKATNKGMLESLFNIQKNTSLPDAVKVNTSEIAHGMMKQRMLKSLGGGIQEFAPQYFQQFSKNIKSRVQTELGPLMAMMGMAGGMSGMEDMMPGGKLGMLGSMGGSMVGDYAGNELAYRLKNKVKKMPGVAKYGNLASYYAQNAPSLMNEWALSQTKGSGTKSSMTRLMKSLAPKFNMQTELGTDKIGGLDQATSFDSHTRKSITEIIPGYLARILQSIEVLRTGDTATDLVMYDLNSNRFSTKSGVKKTIMDRMFSKTSLGRAQADTESVMELLDKNKSLSPAARKMMQSQLLSDAQNNRTINPERYKTGEGFGTFVDDKSKAELMRHFQTNFSGGDADRSRLNEISQRSGMLKYSMPNTKEMAQLYINAGYGGLLEESGIVSKSGFADNLDFNKVLEMYRNGVPGNIGTGSGLPPGRRARKGTGGVLATGSPYSLGTPGYSNSGSWDASGYNSNMGTPKTSIMDDFKTAIMEAITHSRQLDEDRNIKLDEILLRLDGLQQDGKNIGPGTLSFKNRLKSISSGIRGGAKSLYSKLKSITGRVVKLPFAVAGMAFNTAKGLGQMAKNLVFKEITDIYVKGEASPRLLAAKLKAGEYIDQTTKKVIRSIKDIKGPIIDLEGNSILNAADIQMGLFNGAGKRIKLGVMKLLSGAGSMGMGLMGFGVNTAIKLAGLPFKALGKLLSLRDNFKDVYVKGEASPRLLAFRLKAGEYINARTGKVIRSFKDLKDGVKDQTGNVILTAEEASQGLVSNTGSIVLSAFKLPFKLMGGLLEAGKSLFRGGVNLLKRGKNALMGGSKEVTLLQQIRDILDDRLPRSNKLRAGSASDILSHRKGRGTYIDPRTGKKVKAGKDGGDESSSLLSMLGGLGAAVTGLGTVVSSAFGMLKGLGKFAGGAGKMAMAVINNPLTRFAGRAALTGLTSVAGAAWSVGSAAVTGLLGLVSAPVLIGAAAVAAVGVGGYFLYKYLKRKDAYLAKIRLAQYGIDPSNSDKAGTISKLEGLLQKTIQISDKGAHIKMDKDLLEQCLDLFDIEIDDEHNARNWCAWYDKRFKPIYCAHAAAANTLAPGSNFLEADDKIPLASKLEYIRMVGFSNGSSSPYNAVTDPFDISQSLPAGESFPKKYIDEAIAYYKKELAKKGITDDSKTAAKAVGVGTVLAPGMSGKTTEAPPKTLMQKMGDAAKKVAGAIFSLTLPGMALSLFDNLANLFTGKRADIDALKAVRLKAYGLESVDSLDKINSLLSLESAVLKKLTFDNNNIAHFNGSLEEFYDTVAPRFGVNKNNPEQIQRWSKWFTGRFLPVYMTYCTAVKVVSKNIDIVTADEKLKPAQKAGVARAVAGAVGGTGSSIWSIKESPWDGVISNTNPGSCESHIKYLEKQSSQDEIKAQEKVLTNAEASNLKKGSLGSSLLDKAKNVLSGVSDFASSMKDKAKAAYDTASNKVSDTFKGAWDAAGKGAAAVGSGIMAVGNAIIHPGNGSGGDINSLPKPNGPDGKFSTYKDIIAGAAKMVGIDPTLMATMANIESGFKATVKAGTSSATGLYQFVSGTWKDMIAKYGAKYGIAPGTPPTDPRANALMGAEYVKENMGVLNNSIGRPLTETDVYTAHFLGAGGARKLLTADPSANAVQLLSDAAKANPTIFYSNGSPRTVAEVYNHLDELVKRKRVVNGAPAAANDAAMAPPPPPMLAAKSPTAGSGGGVASMLALNPSILSPSGLPTSTNIATTTQAMNQNALAANDKDALQSNSNSDYQTVAMNVQRKASDEFLNGGIDQMTSILAESRNYHKSMDQNIKDLVAFLKSNGMPGQIDKGIQAAQSPTSQIMAENKKAQTVRGPVSMQRSQMNDQDAYG